MTIPVIIDTDPGIDDALALLVALQSAELDIKAITTVSGNVPIEFATRNVMRILDLLPSCARPPVAQGSSKPLRKSQTFAHHVHGEDGLGNLDRLHAADGRPRYPEPKLVVSKRTAVDAVPIGLMHIIETYGCDSGNNTRKLVLHDPACAHHLIGFIIAIGLLQVDLPGVSGSSTRNPGISGSLIAGKCIDKNAFRIFLATEQ